MLGFLLAFTFFESFKVKQWSFFTLVNPAWMLACFAIGISLYNYARELHEAVLEREKARPTAEPAFGFEANPLAPEGKKEKEDETRIF